MVSNDNFLGNVHVDRSTVCSLQQTLIWVRFHIAQNFVILLFIGSYTPSQHIMVISTGVLHYLWDVRGISLKFLYNQFQRPIVKYPIILFPPKQVVVKKRAILVSKYRLIFSYTTAKPCIPPLDAWLWTSLRTSLAPQDCSSIPLHTFLPPSCCRRYLVCHSPSPVTLLVALFTSQGGTLYDSAMHG